MYISYYNIEELYVCIDVRIIFVYKLKVCVANFLLILRVYISYYNIDGLCLCFYVRRISFIYKLKVSNDYITFKCVYKLL